MYRTKTRERIGPLKTEAGDTIESGEKMSNLLNDYFLSVFTREIMTQYQQGKKSSKERIMRSYGM